VTEACLTNVREEMPAFIQRREEEVTQVCVPDGMLRALCQRCQVWPISLNSSINIQLAKRGKMDRVQLSHSIPDLLICAGQVLLAHFGPHDRPLLPWNMHLDKVSPGPGLVGHVDRQDLGHGDGSARGNQAVKHGRPVKWAGHHSLWSGKLDDHPDGRAIEPDKQDKIVAVLIADLIVDQSNLRAKCVLQ